MICEFWGKFFGRKAEFLLWIATQIFTKFARNDNTVRICGRSVNFTMKNAGFLAIKKGKIASKIHAKA